MWPHALARAIHHAVAVVRAAVEQRIAKIVGVVRFEVVELAALDNAIDAATENDGLLAQVAEPQRDTRGRTHHWNTVCGAAERGGVGVVIAVHRQVFDRENR
jgi:hypothetical protein